jgi:c-di-AMP phosphodiesterase-like protein
MSTKTFIILIYTLIVCILTIFAAILIQEIKTAKTQYKLELKQYNTKIGQKIIINDTLTIITYDANLKLYVLNNGLLVKPNSIIFNR